MDFSVVETKEQLELYNDIWVPIWLESGYELESYISPNINRFLIQEHGNYIGTIELMPYDFHFSDINQYGSFGLHTNLQFKNVYEVDKVAIKKEYRKLEVIKEIICFIIAFSIEKKVDYTVGLFNPRFYKVLNRFYKIPIISVENKQGTKAYTPGIIDIVSALHNEELMKRFYSKREHKKSIYATQ